MQDIFVSSLSGPLESWFQAIPDALLVRDVFDVAAQLEAAASCYSSLIFWLHMNESREDVLQSSIAVLRQRYPESKVVVLANMPNQADTLQALSAGAMGYAHAYSAPETLREIRTVIHHGGIWLGQQLLKLFIQNARNQTGNSAETIAQLLTRLTSREKEVAIQASKGLTNKEIARVLDISERTVKAHLAKVFERLYVKDRLQLALMLNQK